MIDTPMEYLFASFDKSLFVTVPGYRQIDIILIFVRVSVHIQYLDIIDIDRNRTGIFKCKVTELLVPGSSSQKETLAYAGPPLDTLALPLPVLKVYST